MQPNPTPRPELERVLLAKLEEMPGIRFRWPKEIENHYALFPEWHILCACPQTFWWMGRIIMNLKANKFFAGPSIGPPGNLTAAPVTLIVADFVPELYGYDLSFGFFYRIKTATNNERTTDEE